MSFATTTFASLGNPIATLTGGGSETISAVTGATTNFSRSTSVTNWTNSYNSGATGANRILMVGISYLNKTNGLEISSVTYNALPLTQVGTATNFMNGRIYIFSLLNPPTGANDLVVNWTAAQTNGAVVGAVTYAGVEQATPTGFVSATNRSTTPSVTVASGTGQFGFGVVDGGSTSTYTTTGTELWSALAYSARTAGAGQSQAGATSVTLSLGRFECSWVAGGVSLQPAYDPLVYQLDWSTTLGSAVTVPSGQAISLAVTNVSASSFYLLYDSSTYPAAISLPATSTNIISVDSLAFYTTPYPGATLAGDSTLSGQTIYLRATVSDPFGAYDVNHLNLAITDPLNNVVNVPLTDAQVVSSNSASRSTNTRGLSLRQPTAIPSAWMPLKAPKASPTRA